jgi:hypothetical protein
VQADGTVTKGHAVSQQTLRLSLTDEDRGWLDQLPQSRTQAVARVQRADAAALCRRTNRIGGGTGATYQSISRGALRFQGTGTGGAATRRDLPGRGRGRSISDEDRAWVVDLACGSWLNLIESFFGKLTRTLLRGIRVSSKAESKARIKLYLQEVNQEPVVF